MDEMTDAPETTETDEQALDPRQAPLPDVGLLPLPDPAGASPDDALPAQAVKVLGNGKIGGWLVKFSSPTDPDLEGDFFTAETYFGPHRTTLVYYEHGYDGVLKRRVLDEQATLKVTDVGVWIEAQLQLRDEYERELERLVQQGKVDWSSGTASHLVEAVPMGNVRWFKAWPLGLDASLTPRPAEPRARAMPLKHLDDAPLVEHVEPTIQETTHMEDELVGQVTNLSTEVAALRSTITEVRSDVDAMRAAPADVVAARGGAIGGGLNARASEEVDYHHFGAIKHFSYRGAPVKQEKYPEGVLGGFCKALWYAQTNVHESRDARKALVEVYGADHTNEAAKALGTQAGVNGAYMIPEQFIPQLMRIAAQKDVLYGKTMVIPAEGGEIVIPALNTRSAWVDGQSAYYGGVTTTWGDDDASATETQPAFDQVRLKTNAITVRTRVKNSLMMRSALTIDAILSQLLGAAIGRARDWAMIRGTGAGKPLGFLNAPALIDAGGSAIDFATLASMEDDVIPEADENYVWVIHTKSRSAIYALQQTNNSLVTFLPDLRGRPMATLLGRPVLWTDKVPYLSGDVSTRVSLIDPGMIVCAEYQGIAIAVSDQVRFEDDETVFRAILSMDAQPWLTSKVEIASGEYVSGFITI